MRGGGAGGARLLGDALLAAATLDRREQLAQRSAGAVQLAVAQRRRLVVRHDHAHLVRERRHHALLPRTRRRAPIPLRIERAARRRGRLADLGRSSLGGAGAQATLLGLLIGAAWG